MTGVRLLFAPRLNRFHPMFVVRGSVSDYSKGTSRQLGITT